MKFSDDTVERGGLEQAAEQLFGVLQEERLLRRSLEIQQRGGHGNSPAMVSTQTRLGGALIAMGASRRAQPLLAAALEATVARCGLNHPDTALARCRLASCLADLGE